VSVTGVMLPSMFVSLCHVLPELTFRQTSHSAVAVVSVVAEISSDIG